MAELEERKIFQGDVFWIEGSLEENPELGAYRHPYVVVQEDVFNHSRVRTVIVCALTSHVEKVQLPGNVLLEKGEGGLAQASVVEVSKISSVNKDALGTYVGRLSEERVAQILAGIRFLQKSEWLK
jgi:mRNA interferase MazF